MTHFINSFNPVPFELAFRAKASSRNSATVTIPASTTAGDLMVLLQRSDNTATSAPADVTPTDWTDIGTTVNNTTFTRVSAKYKIAVGGDASSSITGMDGSVDFKFLWVFKPNTWGTVGSVTASDYTGEIKNSGAASNQTVNLTDDKTGRPIIAFAAAHPGGSGGESATLTLDMSPEEDDSTLLSTPVGNTGLFAVHGASEYKLYNPTDTVSDITVSDGTSSDIFSFYIRVVPA